MHEKREALKPGTITRVDIKLWTMRMVFAAGVGIMLGVVGHGYVIPKWIRSD